jgi:two-component system, LuxR family, sensor kinase FixL
MIQRRKKLDDVVLAAIEREQQRIGNQLHEKLCQTLAGISIQVGLLTGRIREAKPISATHIQQLGQHVQEAIDQARGLSRELRCPQMEGAGLLDALGQLADATAEEVSCEYLCEKPVFVNDAYAAAALFRIAEEAVRNAVEHAKAKKIIISLTRSSSAVNMEVRDNGKGFEPVGSNGGAEGIGLMHRYARAINARLKIQSERGRGTTVACAVPQGD